MQYHYEQHPADFESTVESLRENTYVDNLMKTGSSMDELQNFQQDAISVLEEAKLPIHKSNVKIPEVDDTSNPSKILGHTWNKDKDTLEITVPEPVSKPVTDRNILGKLYL